MCCPASWGSRVREPNTELGAATVLAIFQRKKYHQASKGVLAGSYCHCGDHPPKLETPGAPADPYRLAPETYFQFGDLPIVTSLLSPLALLEEDVGRGLTSGHLASYTDMHSNQNHW